MKLLHIADLHLGKRVNEFSMLPDQQYILDSILKIADDEKPDGVLIAGDVYDKSIPSEDAVRLWDGFLRQLAARGLKVFAVSGNHDSAVRFSNYGELVELAGIYISPVYDGCVEPVTLEDEYGPLNIYLLPFVKPATVREELKRRHSGDAETDETGETEKVTAEAAEAGETEIEATGAGEAETVATEAAETEAVTAEDGDGSADSLRTYQEACSMAVAEMKVNTGERNVIVAHQFVTGAVTCESEEITVGAVDNISASIFDPFDYAALGHIHGPQRVGRDEVRYSGTPLKYSFSEIHHKKSVTVVELKEKGNVVIRTVPLVPLHDMREVEGSFDEIMSMQSSEDYIHAILKEENDIPDAINLLRTVFPNIMKLTYDNERTRSNSEIGAAADVESLSPEELFAGFYELQNNMPMSDEQREFIRQLTESVWEGRK